MSKNANYIVQMMPKILFKKCQNIAQKMPKYCQKMPKNAQFLVL